MIEDPLKQTRRRAEQYRFEDGILELAVGLLSIILGLYFYMQFGFENSPLGEWLTGSFAVLCIGAWLLIRYLTRYLKERITYPRSGYAEAREPQGNNRFLRIAASILAAAVVAGGLAFLQLRATLTWNLMPAVFGLVIALLFGFLAFRSRLTRFTILAFVSLLLGGAFAVVKLLTNVQALSAYCGVMGLVLLVSGGLTLHSYLLRNPIVSGDGDGC
ncbi:MAG: hypothetical protein AB9891_07310 [Anaerolineaceae bacterium]